MNKDRKKELDQFVVNIEFLLISAVQGLALSSLASSSTGLITGLQFEYWPYIISALLFILIFWSEAVIHVLSFIKFPMDMKHNFLYFLAGLIEVVAFSQLTNPLNWFIMFFVFVGVTALLYWTDLRLIKNCEKDFRDSKEKKKLFNHIYKEQLFELKTFVPSGFIFNVIAVGLIYFYPVFFITNKLHILIVGAQIIFAAGILLNSLKNFKRRQELISQV